MNLLPKNRQEFSDKDYWESFFKKRGNKAFEWYGEYPELCDHLTKYVKPKDDILVVGCGNSSMSSDMCDVGYSKITNIDISQVVIKQMTNLHAKKRPNLKFLLMDVYNMSFENESFSAILDKGTLDALMPDNDAKTIENIEKYFDEIERVLKVGGRYVCISLLQSHILDMLMSYFPKHNWLFRIVRCFQANSSNESETSLPVFMVICTKFKSLHHMVLEVNISSGGKMQRVDKLEDVRALISGVQQAAFVCSGLRRNNVSEDNDLSFDLYKQNEQTPRYTIYVVDLPYSSKYLPYAAFIVPQGREVEWLFCTSKGRKHLAKVSKYNRLAVIITHREQIYESLQAMQDELQDAVIQIAPSKSKEKIPFLSLGNDIGNRTKCYQSTSTSSGDYIVEDVEINNVKFRRLFYLNSQSGIQSEAKLKTIRNKKGHTKEIVDHAFLSCRYHTYMSIAIQLGSTDQNPSVAVIGLGGGGLCMFLRKFLPQASITAVDIDKDMLEVATTWFGFKSDDKLNVEIVDGMEYLKKCVNSGKKFSAIVFDIDNKNSSIGMSFPPKEFIEPAVLDDVIKCLHKDGFFTLNLVLRDESLRTSIISRLKSKFGTLVTFKLSEDLNEVVVCTPKEIEEAALIDKFTEGCKKLNTFFKNNQCKDEMLEIEDFVKELTLNETS